MNNRDKSAFEDRLCDFFILGNPKCGTSFLQKYLDLHEEIHIKENEPVYFCDDANTNSDIRNLDAYHELIFQGLDPKKRV